MTGLQTLPMADGELVRLIGGQNLKPRVFGRRDQIVETKAEFRFLALQPVGKGPDPKERAHQRRPRQVKIAHGLP
jgi:hypothetical protein